MAIGCAHFLASLRISSRNSVAGPNTPPPKMIFSGLKRLTRFATAMPQNSMAWARTAFATGSPRLKAAKISGEPERVRERDCPGLSMPECEIVGARGDWSACNCFATLTRPSPEACCSKQPHPTYSCRNGRSNAIQPIAPAMSRAPRSILPSIKMPAPMPEAGLFQNV